MFSFQQLNVTFIQEMGYIAVDIPHFILVLFSLFVCSIQYRQSMNRTSSYVIRKVHILTRIVSQMACVR